MIVSGFLLLVLHVLTASADFDCICNYEIEHAVYKSMSENSQTLGYLYEFDCKQEYKENHIVKGWIALAFEHKVGYILEGSEIQRQICAGVPPIDDLVTTPRPHISTVHTSHIVISTEATKPTTQTTTTTTNPKTTIKVTTPKPTTITTTPKPTTITTTPKPTTITSTPKPTTITTSPKQTTVTTTPKQTTVTTTSKPTTTTHKATPITTTHTPTTNATTSKPTTTTTATPKPTATTTTMLKPTTTTTTSKPTTTTTTYKPTTTTTTPKSTTTTTTPKPTTTTTTPKPTTTTTTPKPTTTPTTTPNPTTATTMHKRTTTTTPQPTRISTTKPLPTTTSLPTTPTPAATLKPTINVQPGTTVMAGHTELCPASVVQSAVNGRGLVTQYGSSCYELIPDMVSWSHAAYKCNQTGGHLVTINSAEEQKHIYDFLSTRYNHPMWIGFHDLVNEETFQWITGEAVTYTNWAPGRRSESDHNLQDCVLMIPDQTHQGKWDDRPCGGTIPFSEYYGEAHRYICEYSIDATLTTFAPVTPGTHTHDGNTRMCPLSIQNNAHAYGGILGQYKDYCYEFLPNRGYSWQHGEQVCAANGGHLAHILNADEQDFVLQFINRHSPHHAFWIGLNDAHHEGTYEWTSGNSVQYTNWAPNHVGNHGSPGAEDCVAFIPYRNGEWDDIHCGSKTFSGDIGETHPILCQYRTTRGISIIG